MGAPTWPPSPQRSSRPGLPGRSSSSLVAVAVVAVALVLWPCLSSAAPPPPQGNVNALLAYLRARFPLPESAVTPSEVAAALVEARVPAAVAGQTADVFRGCDRARFALPNGDAGLLAADAEAAVARLEELA